MIRDFLGPSQPVLFQQFAESLGATYREVESRSKSARGRVDVPFAPWLITLDVQESDNMDGRTFYTRLRIPYLQADPFPFKFELYRGDVFTSIGKLFGMQDLLVGDTRFDKDFIVQGNIPEKVKALLQSERLRELISKQPYVHLRIDEKGEQDNKTLPEGTGLISYKTGGVVTDPAVLTELLEIVQLTIGQMVGIGLASQEDPDFVL